MIPPATQWIKKNMMGEFSEELGRKLTDPEMRVKRSLEQLQVPDWYKKYSKPMKFLKSSAPIDRRPPTWKTFKQKHASGNTPKKTPKKCTPRKVVHVHIQPVQNAAPPTPLKPTICGVQPKPGYRNEKYRIQRKSILKRKNPSISITPSSSDTECDLSLQMSHAHVRTVNKYRSHTFPRVKPSRKIQNINIVFDKPFPGASDKGDEWSVPPPLPKSAPPKKSAQKNMYAETKKIDLEISDDANVSCSTKLNNSHTSFLFAEVEPSGIGHQVHGSAGLDSSYDIEDNEMLARCSPHTRFFNSSKKSQELEKIVQTELSQSKDAGNRSSLIQDIIEELDRSVAEGRSFLSTADDQSASDGFVKGMIQALEDSYRSSVIVDHDEEKLSGSDSELARSTTISMYENSGDESASSIMPGRSCYVSSGTDEEEYDYEEETFWIPVKTPSVDKSNRTSSRSSVLSRTSNRSVRSSCRGHSSPMLSPIKVKPKRSIEQRYWSSAASYQKKRDRPTTSRRLFKIDEAGVADSGYTTTNSSSSRICTMSSYGSASVATSSGASSRSSSQSTSPDLLVEYNKVINEAVISRSSDAFMLKSIFV